MKILQRKIHATTYSASRAEGLSDAAAKIIASRTEIKNGEVSIALKPGLDKLDSWELLPDIHIAAERIATAIINNEFIAFYSDYDCDGCTNSAVVEEAMTEYFGVEEENMLGITGNRFEDGYGLSDPAVDKILKLERKPTLITTGDCGSSDEARIKRLKEAGIEVIVTDHHGIPAEGIPVSAIAVVTPLRDDSEYPDKGIAGCFVGWLTMCGVAQKLREKGRHVKDLTPLLDYVGLGTVADCVTLCPREVHNNRAVVQYALSQMNRGARPAWRAFKKTCITNGGEFTAETCSFFLSPAINSLGRVDDGKDAVKFLRATTEQEASRYLKRMLDANNERKSIQKELVREALIQGEEQVAQGKNTIVARFSPGHSGVHGIVASRVVETFGRPTICLSDKHGDVESVSGSCRSIEGVNLRDILQEIDNLDNSILKSYGGHKAACGLQSPKAKVDDLVLMFESEGNKVITKDMVGPRVKTDGVIAAHELSLDVIYELKQLEPYGIGFEAPTFDGVFRIRGHRVVGKDMNHMQVYLTDTRNNHELGGIWFFFESDETGTITFSQGQDVRVVYTLSENNFRGETNLQLMIKSLEVI